MILAIDGGNTHIAFGCVENGEAVGELFRISTDRHATDYEYVAKLKGIFELRGIDRLSFEGAVLSCVVPPLTPVLTRAVRMLTGLEPLVVGAGVKTGLHIAINDPGTVASDLVAAAVAAKEEYPLPCVIIDMGTATTLTVVDEKGRYVGGAILPGAKLSLGALSEGTALLPHIEIQPPRNVIAANTVDSMKAGIVYGTAGALDGLLDRFEEALGMPPASIVATGGMSRLICPFCRHAVTLDDTLLLKGLWLIWKRNR
ncbi:MAG: type III pantothenate kinase [Ruminococcaceae bacterium]|nr:type III pantothenate kinase [Oscillospiraceae bacterium]